MKTDSQIAVAVGDPILAEITRRLVDTYRPERIYLFSAHARHSQSGQRLRSARGRPGRRPPWPAAKRPGLRGPLGAPDLRRHPHMDPHRLRRASAPPCVLAVHGGARREAALFPLTRCGRRTPHCQQAVEKALKAFLASHDRPFRKTHDLVELGAECVAIDVTLEPHLRATALLTEYAWRYRYPGEPSEPEESEIRQALDRARAVVTLALGQVPAEAHP